MSEHLPGIDTGSPDAPDPRKLLFSTLTRAVLTHGVLGFGYGLTLHGPKVVDGGKGWNIIARASNGNIYKPPQLRALIERDLGFFSIKVNYSSPLSFKVGYVKNMHNTHQTLVDMSNDGIGSSLLPRSQPFVYLRQGTPNRLLDDPFESQTLIEIFNDLNLRFQE